MPKPKPETAAPAPRRGSTSKYHDDIPKQAEKLCLLGAIDREMADFFGVTVKTWHEWKHSHPELRTALDKGKGQADAVVERKLWERATGYSHPEDDIRTISVGGGLSEVVKTETIRHYPPDTVACIFWLKNRQPERWRANPVEGEEAPIPAKVVLEVVDGRRINAKAEPAPG